MSHSSNAAKHTEEILNATNRIESSDPTVVVQGLNILTKKSFEALEGHNIQFEHYPQLAVSLGSLLDVVNPLKDVVFESFHDSHWESDVDYVWERWSCSGNIRLKALAYNIDDNSLLLTTLNIVRNLSFDAVNEQVIAASAAIMQHLVSIVIVSLESGGIYQATHMALETLANIGPRIDLTGRKRLLSYYFSEDTVKMKSSADALQRNLMKLRGCRDMSTATFVPYMTAVSALMAAIAAILSGNGLCDRSVALKATEILARIAVNTDNAPYLLRSPPELITGLVQLLCTNNTVAEPLVSDICHINGDPLGRQRAPAAVYLASRAMIAASAVPVPQTSTGGPQGQPAGPGASIGGSQSTQLSESASGLNITFDGVRLESAGAGLGGSAYPSTTSLTGLSSSSYPTAPPPRPIALTTGNGAAITVENTPALCAMTTVAPFFIEGCDLEMRDTVIDALHALSTMSIHMQLRLLQEPRLVELLLRVSRSYNSNNPWGGVPGASTQGSGGSNAGTYSNTGMAGGIVRTEGMVKALQVLSMLLALPEGGRTFLALQSEFMVAACSDDFIAEVVCNKALPVQQEAKARLAYSLQQQQQIEAQNAAETQSTY